MTSREIREKFLKFFERHGHRRVRSASLIPAEDPTLYFTNAGMVPFKDYFTGRKKAPFPRATSSQKCLRVSGKHNDLENVGRTSRHHTFFEMLGNFSFGDYFKDEAIRFAWDFLTLEMKIPEERLWITVFEDDDEAAGIWQKKIGIPPERILRFGEKDNFWSMGETGPCGPCSEIHFDHGEKYGCGRPAGGAAEDHKKCGVGCDCDRFMEIWNLVFMQYERDAAGKMSPLPKPSIDTGMGLERLAAIAQGVHSNYDSDLFTPIIREIEKLTNRRYLRAVSAVSEVTATAVTSETVETNVSIRVLADHIRASVFLIADGVQPSNEGRGYVLRRIMRRAIRHGRLLGRQEAFFYRLTEVVAREMGEAYPEIVREKGTIEKVIRAEEEKFLETVDKGLEILSGELDKAARARAKVLPGEVVFALYDTFGFPIDLTELIAQEKGLDVDMAGFERLMEGQRDRGRKAWKGSTGRPVILGLGRLGQGDLGQGCQFTGYDRLEDQSPVLAVGSLEGKPLPVVRRGEKALVVTEKTPFYPEGGGQVGDQGMMEAKKVRVNVLDTKKSGDAIFHIVEIKEGDLKEGDEVHLKVDSRFREGSRHHHSATHLMHAALRAVLGTHVRQAGSLVEPTRLRFDFTHFEAVGRTTLREIEELVNRKIEAALPVTHELLPYDEAIRRGALAFFEEKYGDQVRVVKMGDFSVELCGGTHVRSTGEIGLFKFTGESSVAAGIRRVEAVVGQEALKRLQKLEDEMSRIAQSLKVPAAQVADRIERLLDQVRQLERKLEDEKKRQATGEAEEEVRDVKGIKLLLFKAGLDDPKGLRDLSDRKIQRLGTGIALLGGVAGDKISLILRVSKDLASRYDAGALMKEVTAAVGGTGGGRPDMAQGGILADRWPEAVGKLQGLLAL